MSRWLGKSGEDPRTREGTEGRHEGNARRASAAADLWAPRALTTNVPSAMRSVAEDPEAQRVWVTASPELMVPEPRLLCSVRALHHHVTPPPRKRKSITFCLCRFRGSVKISSRWSDGGAVSELEGDRASRTRQRVADGALWGRGLGWQIRLL